MRDSPFGSDREILHFAFAKDHVNCSQQFEHAFQNLVRDQFWKGTRHADAGQPKPRVRELRDWCA